MTAEQELWIVPNCDRIILSSIDSISVLNAVHNFIESTLSGDAEHFYNSTLSTVGLDTILELTSEENKIIFSTDNSNNIKCILENSPLNNEDIFVSPELSIANVDSGILGNRLHIAEYPDAILLGFNNHYNSAWSFACHVGKIYCPNHLSDPERGSDGHGILGGNPEFSKDNTQSNDTWFSLNSESSLIRVGNTGNSSVDWCPVITLNDLYFLHAGLLGGYERIAPVSLRGALFNNLTNEFDKGPIVGTTKYIKEYKSNQPHRALVPSDDPESDQAWLIFNSDHLNPRNSLILWNKCVAP